MNLEIITPGKSVFSGKAESITLPGADGSFGILNNHAPIIATLQEGEVNVTTADNGVQNFPIAGGVVEVLNNKVVILAESK